MALTFELVLPCYNESRSLKKLVARAKAAALAAGHTPETFRLVLVENGSKDDSAHVLKELRSDAELGAWFRVVPVVVNQGYGFGIWSGLRTTQAKFVGWSHADQQCDPADAFKALKIVESAGEAVLAKGIRRGRSLKERIVSRVFDFFARALLSFAAYEINAQPKVFRRELLDLCVAPPKDFAFDVYVLYVAAKAGYRFETFEVEFPPRVHGFSNWAATFFGRYKTIFNMIRYMWRLRRSGSVS